MIIHAGGKFSVINRLLHTRRLLPGFLAANLLLLGWACCMPAAAAADLGVEVIEASMQTDYAVTRWYGGEVRAGRSSSVGFRHPGELHRVHVREGDSVDAGQLLAELDPEPLQAALAQARAGLDLARAQERVAETAVELATATLRRHQDLIERGHTSAQHFDELRLELDSRRARLDVARAETMRAQAQLRSAELDVERGRIHAPYPARIQTRHADEGTMLAAGQTVLRLLESGRREARIGLPTAMATDLQPDAPFLFRHQGRKHEGRLLHVLPEVDTHTRTLTALFELSGQELPAAGSVIELGLARTLAEPGFWLPLAALSEAQRGLWSVFVVVTDGDHAGKDRGRVERRLVEVLHSAADQVFVRGTLADGERVIATGIQRVVPGQQVQILRLRPMLATGSKP